MSFATEYPLLFTREGRDGSWHAEHFLIQGIRADSYDALRSRAREIIVQEFEAPPSVDPLLPADRRSFEAILRGTIGRLRRQHHPWTWWLRGGRVRQCGVYSFPNAGFFTQVRLMTILVSTYDLEGPILPTGGTYGLFAFDGAELHYMTRQLSVVETLFRQERRPLTDADSTELASVLAEALCREGGIGDRLVTRDSVLALGERPGYGLDREEMRRVEGQLAPPMVSQVEHGWVVSYTAIRGFAHEYRQIRRVHFDVAPDFSITWDTAVLSDRLFRSTPNIGC